MNIINCKQIRTFTVKDIISKGKKKCISLIKYNKKKCLIKNAKLDNLILLKDYHLLHENWYSQIKNLPNYNVILFKNLLTSNERYFDLCIGKKGYKYIPLIKETLIPYKEYSAEILKKLDIYIGGGCFLVKTNLIKSLLNSNQNGDLLKDTFLCNKIFKKINYNLKLSESIIIVRKINMTEKYINRNKEIVDFDKLIQKLFPTLV